MIGQAFYLAAPVALAGILHMVVVKKGWLASLAHPIDGGATFRGRPIFGPNKTWRGVVFMIAATALLGLLQGLLFPIADPPLHYGGPSGYLGINAAIGVGYVLGELPNSFAKRQLDITPGKVSSGMVGAFFFLLDQADSVVAGLLLCWVCFDLSGQLVLIGSLCLTLLHLAINGALYLSRVRKNL